MTEFQLMRLKLYRQLAEAYNKMLRNFVDELSTFIPEDLASDFIYEVINLDELKNELEGANRCH